MQAENKLLVNDKFIKYTLSVFGDTLGKTDKHGDTGIGAMIILKLTFRTRDG